MDIWAIDDGVKVDPVTGEAWEARWDGGDVPDGYRERNWVWDGATRTITLNAARNEAVAFQVIVDGPVKGLRVQGPTFSGPGNIPDDHVQCFRQWYVRNRVEPDHEVYPNSLGNGWIPDALVPMNSDRYGAPLDVPDPVNAVPDQRTQGLWFDVFVPADTEPGHYEGAIELTAQGDAERVAVRLTVHPVTIPDDVGLHIALNTYGELEQPGRDPRARLAYYQMAHAHRGFVEIDAFNFDQSRPTYDAESGTITDWAPFDVFFAPILDGTAFTPEAGYGPGPRVGRPIDVFFLPYAVDTPRPDLPNNQKTTFWPVPHDVAVTPEGNEIWIRTLKAFERHFDEMGWSEPLVGVFLNGLDEPLTEEAWRNTVYYGELVRRSGTGFFYRADTFVVALIGERVPGWTPETLFAETGHVIDLYVVECGSPDRVVFDREPMRRWRTGGEGRQIWSYNGTVPCTGGVSVCFEAIGPRVLGWMADAYDLDGFHPSWEYMWHNADAWTAETNFRHSYPCFVYPERTAASDGHGIDVPCASIRLKHVRRGAQDYELLRLLRAAGRGDEADAIRKSAFRMALDEVVRVHGPDHRAGGWSHNPGDWHAAHVKLLEALGRS